MIFVVAKENSVAWVKKGDLVVFRANVKDTKWLTQWMPTAPQVRFGTKPRTQVSVPVNTDNLAIVVDKYRVSTKWGNDRHRLSWVHHLLYGEHILYFAPDENRSYGVEFSLQLAENLSDDREALQIDG